MKVGQWDERAQNSVLGENGIHCMFHGRVLLLNLIFLLIDFVALILVHILKIILVEISYKKIMFQKLILLIKNFKKLLQLDSDFDGTLLEKLFLV